MLGRWHFFFLPVFKTHMAHHRSPVADKAPQCGPGGECHLQRGLLAATSHAHDAAAHYKEAHGRDAAAKSSESMDSAFCAEAMARGRVVGKQPQTLPAHIINLGAVWRKQ